MEVLRKPQRLQVRNPLLVASHLVLTVRRTPMPADRTSTSMSSGDSPTIDRPISSAPQRDAISGLRSVVGRFFVRHVYSQSGDEIPESLPNFASLPYIACRICR